MFYALMGRFKIGIFIFYFGAYFSTVVPFTSCETEETTRPVENVVLMKKGLQE